MEIYKRLFSFLSPYKGLSFFAVICMFSYALTNGAMAYLIGPVLKFLFSSSGDQTEIQLIPFDLVVLSKEEMMVAVPVVIIIVAGVKGLTAFAQSYLLGRIGLRVVADVRQKLYMKILDMPMDYFMRNPTGELSSRLTNDVSWIQNLTTETIARVLKQSFTIVVLLCVVIGMDWRLSIAALIVFPLIFYPLVRFGKRMKKVSIKGQTSMASLTALLQEAITGIRIVKAYCMEGYEAGRFGRENEEYTKYQLKGIVIKALSSPLIEIMGAVGFAATIWYAAYRIQNGTLAPESFISFFAAVMMLYQPIKSLNGVNLSIQQGLAGAVRVFEVLDEKCERDIMTGDKSFKGVTGSIEFRDVSFGYGDKTVLKGINFKVDKGQMVAIVGMSGSGKTTLVNLMSRFHDVGGGRILIDGEDIRGLKLKELRRETAIVSQHVVLFNDTARKNVAYGDDKISEASVREATAAANAHGFIERLPNGYDTVIGEAGVKLSGGERQRLSIARAILKDASILVMDEATSALDTESEIEVQKGLGNLMKGRTSFVIAHRLSTVRDADMILVLKEGSLIESGTHDELMEAGGEYSRIYELQFHGKGEAATGR